MPARSAPTVGWRAIRAWRSRRHGLDRRRSKDQLLDLVAGLCGLHAQLLSSAEQSLWARLDDLAPGDLERWLWTERSLVKTWAMRGTLHLLPAAEYPFWQAALGTYRHYLKPSWLRAFGVTGADLERLITAIAHALEDQPLTREQLAAAVGRRTRSRALGGKLMESWGVLLKPAAFRGQLCFGPGEGTKVRFTRPDRWLGPYQASDGPMARAEALLRYLGVHGPATREDLARWWGIGPAEASRSLALLGDRVTPIAVDGAPHWTAADQVSAIEEADPVGTVRLLPAFDQYVIAATRQIHGFFPNPKFKDLVYRQQGWLSAVLVVDGRIDGIWKAERSGRRLSVEISPFTPIKSATRRAAEAEAERLAGFTEATLDLRWKDPG